MANRPVVYSVAAVAPESVRQDLERVWRDSLPLRTSPEAKFKHLHQDAPDVTAHVFVLRARNADVADERVVGTIGVCVRRYWMVGQEVRAAVTADFAVDVEHRLLLPALQLARMAREHAREHFELGYGYPNKNADGVMLRAGFQRLGHTSRHVYLLRPAAYLGRIRDGPTNVAPAVAMLLARPFIARALGPIADGSRLVLDLVRAAPAAWAHRLVWSHGPHAQVDALWEAARHEYPIVGARTTAFLSWRYPGARFASLIRRGGDLRGYAIIETDPATGAAYIRDLFGHHDSFEPLLGLLLPSLWRQGAASVSVSLLGSPRVRRMLGRRGFITRGERGTVVVQVGDRAPSGVDASDPDSWHLFDADEDA